MSTYYSAKIKQNENYTFNDYVKTCARAFGALLHMRDEPDGAPITLPPEENLDTLQRKVDEAEEKLKERQAELNNLKQLTHEQLAELCRERLESNIAKAQAGLAKAKVIEDRYGKMREKVTAWTPPTESHQRLKNFMLEQLDLERHDDVEYYTDKLEELAEKSKENIHIRIGRLFSDAELLVDEYEKCLERKKADLDTIKSTKYGPKTKWIIDLLESIGEEPPIERAN